MLISELEQLAYEQFTLREEYPLIKNHLNEIAHLRFLVFHKELSGLYDMIFPFTIPRGAFCFFSSKG